MAPNRNALLLEEEPLSSGPPTKRSARFEAARPVAPIDDEPESSGGYMPVLERSDIMLAVQRREPQEPMELMDEDLELLFDDDVVEVSGPDTERTPRVDSTPPHSEVPSTVEEVHDTEPPPTMRSPSWMP